MLKNCAYDDMANQQLASRNPKNCIKLIRNDVHAKSHIFTRHARLLLLLFAHKTLRKSLRKCDKHKFCFVIKLIKCKQRDIMCIIEKISRKQAFEILPQHTQIQELYNCGVKKRALAFSIAWMSERKIRTKIGHVYSDSDVITSGCQQGSRLGPPYFTWAGTKRLALAVDRMVEKQIVDLSLNNSKIAAKRLKNNFWHLEYADDCCCTIITRPENQEINRKILAEYESWAVDTQMVWHARKSKSTNLKILMGLNWNVVLRL